MTRRMAREPEDDEGSLSNTDDRLRLLVERIERLEEEKKGIADDIKDVYSEAKATGYDPKIIREVIKQRKKNPDDRQSFFAVLNTYACALGMDLL